MRALTVNQMREIEKKVLEQGMNVDQLMQNAGVHLAKLILSRKIYPSKTIIGLIGTGNNGGDTLVALAVLAKSGWEAHAYMLKNRSGDDEAFKWFQQVGGKILIASKDVQFSGLGRLINSCAVLIDGFLGTGIKLPLKKEIDEILRFIKLQAHIPYIYAVDCPSGVDCNTGETAEYSLPAAETVCMGAVKTGLLKFPAFSLAGELSQVDLGIPEELFDDLHSQNFVISQEDVLAVLPERPKYAHKGTFGTALIVGGSIMFPGAPLLAAKAAYKIGAGLVQIASTTVVQQTMAGACPEATWFVLPSAEGVIGNNACEVIRKQLVRGTTTAIGMGMGHEESTIKLFEQLFPLQQKSKKEKGIGFAVGSDNFAESIEIINPSLVIDADGLHILSKIDAWYEKIPPETILTPHIGEMSRLTGLSIEEIQAERWEVAVKYAKLWKTILLLKGALTVIAEPGGKLAIIPIATPALAKAGSGDVLAGVICGLRAQGLSAFEAAWCGAWLHGKAGLLAEKNYGNNVSITACNVIDSISGVISNLK